MSEGACYEPPLLIIPSSGYVAARFDEEALDFAEELPGDMRTTLAQMWKYLCRVRRLLRKRMKGVGQPCGSAGM